LSSLTPPDTALPEGPRRLLRLGLRLQLLDKGPRTLVEHGLLLLAPRLRLLLWHPTVVDTPRQDLGHLRPQGRQHEVGVRAPLQRRIERVEHLIVKRLIAA